MSSLSYETPALESNHAEDSSELSSATTAIENAARLNAQNVNHNSKVPWRFHRQQPSTADIDVDSEAGSTNSTSTLHPIDTSNHLRPELAGPPLSAGLRIQTDITPGLNLTAASATTLSASRNSPESPRLSRTNSIPITRSPSVKKAIANSVGSAASSVVSSPMLSAMSDVTPLPSPLMSSDSPGPWKKLLSRPTSRDLHVPVMANSTLVTANGESLDSAMVNAQKRRNYHGLMNTESNLSSQLREKNAEGHNRNRSVSEYVPEALQVCKQRHVTVSASHTPHESILQDGDESQMRREPNLAIQRGLSAANGSTLDQQQDNDQLSAPDSTTMEPSSDYFEARMRSDNKKRRWRPIRMLGEGTFSKVLLATSQFPEDGFKRGGESAETTPEADETGIDPKSLVAIKICEHGPKGGASEERVEISLKRELDMLKSIHHPSLVNLKAWAVEETRAILVLNYCAGGDLFDLAALHMPLIVPSLLRRMFSELVGAIRYLHECHIVHRDIKLENILVNLPPEELKKDIDWQTYPYSVVTLTDLGLSRRIADDEMLTTRCGSDDYAPPEVILGSAYDGRLVDAWSLGVVLYALIEGRLPFDPPPNASALHKQRSKTSHRICRVEWRWMKYNGNAGEYEADLVKFEKAGLTGAMKCTEALLKKARYRTSLDKLAEDPWVKDGISVEGGVRFRDEDDDADCA